MTGSGPRRHRRHRVRPPRPSRVISVGVGVGAVSTRPPYPSSTACAPRRRDVVAGGTQRNHAFVTSVVDWGATPTDGQLLLADVQTSGGLLVATDQAGRDG